MERRLEEERRIEEMKAAIRKTNKDGETSVKNGVLEGQVRVKLPKLVIGKFDGTHLDWFRFWNQFETQIGPSKTISDPVFFGAMQY